MSPRILRSPEAERDIVEIGLYIAETSLTYSDLFLESVETTLIALARMPRVGFTRNFRNPKYADIRIWRVKGFENYLIFYRPITDGIEILRIIHGARDIEILFE